MQRTVYLLLILYKAVKYTSFHYIEILLYSTIYFLLLPKVMLDFTGLNRGKMFPFTLFFLCKRCVFCLNKIQSDLLIHKKCPEFGLIKNEYYVLTRNFSKRPKKPVKLGNESHIQQKTTLKQLFMSQFYLINVLTSTAQLNFFKYSYTFF